MKFDIKAKVTNLRTSGNYFSTKYRPNFQILDDYATTGEIELIDTDKVHAGECAEAYVRFLSPEDYPHSLWVGREIEFKEGNSLTGIAIVNEIYNDILLKHN